MNSNKDNKNYGYIRFPLSFLKKLKMENNFNFILSFGVINYARQLEVSIDEIVREIIYNFFNSPEKLSRLLIKKIEEHEFDVNVNQTTNELIITGELFIDDSRKGFTSDGAEIDLGAIDGLYELLEKDREFYELAEINCKILKAVKLLHLVLNDIDEIIKNHKKALEFENIFNTDPWTSVKTNLIFDAKNNNLSPDLFRLVCAIKSKLGKKSFCKIYKKEILNRMFGCKNQKTLNELFENDEEVKKHYEHLSKRYPFDKLIREAINKKLIAVIPSNRGYYISTKYNMKKLKKEVEQLRIKNSKVKLRIKGSKLYSKLCLN